MAAQLLEQGPQGVLVLRQWSVVQPMPIGVDCGGVVLALADVQAEEHRVPAIY